MKLVLTPSNYYWKWRWKLDSHFHCITENVDIPVHHASFRKEWMFEECETSRFQSFSSGKWTNGPIVLHATGGHTHTTLRSQSPADGCGSQHPVSFVKGNKLQGMSETWGATSVAVLPSQNKTRISKILTKYNCQLQLMVWSTKATVQVTSRPTRQIETQLL